MFLKTGPRTEIAAARGDIPALEQCGRIPDSVFMFIGLLDNEHAFSVFDWAYSRGYIFGKSVITILLYSADARVLELVTEHMYDDIVEDE